MATRTDDVPTVVVRPLEERDWPQVHAIVVEVAEAGETYAMEVPADEAATRDFWRGELLVVAVDGDTVLGSAKAGPNRPAQGAHVGTASFMVARAARGRGVGRLLGEHVVAWHRAQGFEAIQFNAVVATNVAAVALWRSLGFRVVGNVPGAFRRPSGELADLHVMHLDLAVAEAYAAPLGASDRDRLLVAAARSFAERGWHETHLEGVAAAAGLDLAVAERFGRDRAQLLWSALVHVVLPPHQDLTTAVEQLRLEELDSVDDRLDSVVTLLCDILVRLAPLVTTLNEAAAADPDVAAMVRGSDLRRLAATRRLGELLRRGERTHPDATTLIHVLMTAETYLGFVRAGWSMDRYAVWLRGALDHAVNGPWSGAR